ncbi:uncharacterized protein K489DRAFT_64909 [Dissoconium aciculare CBS 342.82]|uniref:Uncharacterized protein n=1 Tax=Dissoconium aciculare CBS 342.82 TaxID=1314786 RepID=A0A6J3LUN7_9PEZI|nr:uncharacterized protein K489DRAFT_64909 [Dissoconium aciculare CBS 342.82]KAF1819373.1 hypothetical protein K489DRAFT_64909 [Dissoconium aciculare CBS 342.82]
MRLRVRVHHHHHHVTHLHPSTQNTSSRPREDRDLDDVSDGLCALWGGRQKVAHHSPSSRPGGPHLLRKDTVPSTLIPGRWYSITSSHSTSSGYVFSDRSVNLGDARDNKVYSTRQCTVPTGQAQSCTAPTLESHESLLPAGWPCFSPQTARCRACWLAGWNAGRGSSARR